MGAEPESYGYIRAAKYMGVAPWELLDRDDGRYWSSQAIAIQNAENLAQQDLNKHHGR